MTAIKENLYCANGIAFDLSQAGTHSTPLHQGGNAECDKQGSNAKSSFAVLCILHTAQTPQPWPRYISTPTSHPADHHHVLLPVPALHCHQDTCH